eukprot:3354195-Amphidinium_carterae.1
MRGLLLAEDVLKSRCPRLKLLAVTTKLLEQLDGLGSVTTHSSAPHAILVVHLLGDKSKPCDVNPTPCRIAWPSHL